MTRKRTLVIGLAGVAACALGLVPPRAQGQSTVVFVDVQLSAPSCPTYDPATRTCAAGSVRAFRSLALAAPAVAPGVTVVVRGGTYGERLVPPVSGTEALPIAYRRHESETVTITGADFDPAIDLSGRSHVIIDGFTVADVVGWLRAENTHHTIVRHCSFARATASGSRAGLKFVRATYNRVEDNLIEDGNDNLSLIDSTHNVIERNSFRRGRHALWNILCGSYNIVRGNSFHNAIQKIGQITDCEGVPSDVPLKFNATAYNLVEENTFEYVPSSGRSSPYSGIQYAAQHGIIRRNRFYATTGPGIQLTLYADEARYLTDTRIYHNVFDGTSYAGIEVPRAGYTFARNLIKNNILSNSVFVANDTRWPWFTQELAGKPVQVLLQRQDGVLFDTNIIASSEPAQAYTVTYGSRTATTNPPQHSLSWWHQNVPALFARNLDMPPMYVDREGRDFHLLPESAGVDAGAFLTATTSAGSGATVPVQDASYFVDGFGIPGETGDVVRLQGQRMTYRVKGVDYAANTVTLDAVASWTTGQGLSLRYAGSAPDIGAFETSRVERPRVPTGLRIIR